MKSLSFCLVLSVSVALSGCYTPQKFQNQAYYQPTSAHAVPVVTYQPSTTVVAPPPPPVTNLPNDEFATEIDNGFKRWSSLWTWDIYTPNSIRIVDRNLKDNIHIFRGGFSFVRGRSSHTIPFVAEFTQLSQGYKLANLCYNDNTSGMIRCIDPSIDNIAKVRHQNELIGLGVIAGVVVIIASTNNGSSSVDMSSDKQERDIKYDMSLRARFKRDREISDAIENNKTHDIKIDVPDPLYQ